MIFDENPVEYIILFLDKANLVDIDGEHSSQQIKTTQFHFTVVFKNICHTIIFDYDKDYEIIVKFFTLVGLKYVEFFFGLMYSEKKNS